MNSTTTPADAEKQQQSNPLGVAATTLFLCLIVFMGMQTILNVGERERVLQGQVYAARADAHRINRKAYSMLKEQHEYALAALERQHSGDIEIANEVMQGHLACDHYIALLNRNKGLYPPGTNVVIFENHEIEVVYGEPTPQTAEGSSSQLLSTKVLRYPRELAGK